MRIIRINNKGWRARFDDGFDEENLSRIADAFGYIWAQSTPGATIYVGYDTRLNGRRYASLVGAVVAAYGLNVIVSSDPCPTPAVGWATFTDDNAAGAIIGSKFVTLLNETGNPDLALDLLYKALEE